MTRILGIAGSLRSGSFNAALLRAAKNLVPPGATLDIATIQGIPLYDGDIEASSGLPDAVVALKEKIAACDGLLLATPEYNNGIPGVFKNAIDWCSRPVADIPRVFGNRPTALMGASPSGFGTILAQDAWLPVLRKLGAQYWAGGSLFVSRAPTVFDDAGELVDETIKAQLRQFMHDFAKFAGERKPG